MNKLFTKFYGAVLVLSLPLLVSAATTASFQGTYITNVITGVSGWVSSLIAVLIGVGLLVFLWGLIKYVTAGSDAKKKEEARGLMIYGVIALFVMTSVWGLVGLLGQITGVSQGGGAVIPTL